MTSRIRLLPNCTPLESRFDDSVKERRQSAVAIDQKLVAFDVVSSPAIGLAPFLSVSGSSPDQTGGRSAPPRLCRLRS